MVIEDSNLAELRDGELEVIGRLVDASNASLLCLLPSGKQVVYKPIAGERPLWDFPDGNLAYEKLPLSTSIKLLVLELFRAP